MLDENEKKGRAPDYKGDGIAVWVNSDKNKKTYLSIKVLDSINLKAWKNEPKPKATEKVEL